MNKKGEADMLLIVGYLVLILVTTFSLVYWVNQSGNLVKDATIAKQTSLLIDAAMPGTTILLDQNVTIFENNVLIGTSKYSFFKKRGVLAEKVDGGTKITIE